MVHSPKQQVWQLARGHDENDEPFPPAVKCLILLLGAIHSKLIQLDNRVHDGQLVRDQLDMAEPIPYISLSPDQIK